MNTRLPTLLPTSGYVLVLCSIFFAATVDLLVKFVAEGVGTWQLVFMRWAIAIAFLIPWVAFARRRSLKVNDKSIYFYRTILNCIGSFTLFYSLATLPLSIVVTILFSGPVFMVPLAILILGEKPKTKEIISCLLGFVGIIVVYNPADIPITIESLAPICSAITSALSQVLTKKLGAKESAMSLMFWLAVATAVLTVPLAINGWVTLSPFTYGIIALMALCGTAGSLLMIIGLRRVEVPKVAPLNYLTVPIAFVAGLLLFDEQPSLHTIVGCLIIITAVTLPNSRKLFPKRKLL